MQRFAVYDGKKVQMVRAVDKAIFVSDSGLTENFDFQAFTIPQNKTLEVWHVLTCFSLV